MYNILKPELIWVEGRCYRSNDSHTNVTHFQEHDLYNEEIPFQDEVDDDDDDEGVVYMMDNNRYGTNVHVSKHYLGAIIGKKGAVKMRIERDTKTDIKVPRQGENKDIVIHGPSASNVKAARRKINMIVMSSRMKQSPTHFISIPVNKPDIVNNFETFKHEVLQHCKGIEEPLFIASSKLHVTVGVLRLMDNEERMLAANLLNEAKEKVVTPLIRPYLPLRARVRGLSYMEDDPRATHVLYARVCDECAPTGTLQRVVDAIFEHFYKAGFMDREFERENVKMHMTLMNSKYSTKTQDVRTQAHQPFDASEVLAKYSEHDFGVVEINEIHLSQRRSMGADGYYQPTSIISCGK